MKMRLVSIATAVVIATMWGIGVVLADEKTDAKEHFEAGFELWEKKDYAAAAAEFELSAKLYENKNNLYNLASCYMSLARSIDALTVFEKVLSQYGADLDEEMKRDIEARLEEINAMVAKVKLDVNNDGAVVKIDGKEIGVSPLQEPVTLMPGEHEIEITLDGYKPIVKRITTVSGSENKVVAKLETTKAQISIVTNVNAASVLVNGRFVGKTPLSSPLILDGNTPYRISLTKDGYLSNTQEVQFRSGESQTLRIHLEKPISHPQPPPKQSPVPGILFWGGISGTATSAVISGILWGIGASKFSQYKDKVSAINTGNFANVYGETTLRREADELKDQSMRLNKAAVGMTITTGAFAVMAVVGWFLRAKDQESSNAVELSVRPGAVEVRF
jgi:tetratricopeptide (TPR) repeat protein